MGRRDINPSFRYGESPVEGGCTSPKRPLHRLAAVREAKGLSQCEMAQRLKLSVDQVKLQEQETSDLRLSVVSQWARALGVPLTVLLAEAGAEVAFTQIKPDQALQLMELVKGIRRAARRPAVQRMAQTLVEQLLEIAPELEDLGPARASGFQRTDRPERPRQRPLSENLFIDWENDGN